MRTQDGIGIFRLSVDILLGLEMESALFISGGHAMGKILF